MPVIEPKPAGVDQNRVIVAMRCCCCCCSCLRRRRGRAKTAEKKKKKKKKCTNSCFSPKVEKFPHFQSGPLLNLSLFVRLRECVVYVYVYVKTPLSHSPLTCVARSRKWCRRIFVRVASPSFFFLLFFTFVRSERGHTEIFGQNRPQLRAIINKKAVLSRRAREASLRENPVAHARVNTSFALFYVSV